MNRRLLARGGVLLLLWLLLAAPVAGYLFTHGTKTTVVAGHSTVITPTFDGFATVDLGPFLPNLRYPSGQPLGAHLDLGKTDLTTYTGLIERYALLGAQPQGEIAKVVGALEELAWDSATDAALIGLVAPGLYLLLGERRRRELVGRLTSQRLAVSGLVVLAVGTALVQPWERDSSSLEQPVAWRSIEEELPDVPIPEEAEPLQVEVGLFSSGTKRLATSMLDTYRKSLAFYDEVTAAVPSIADELRTPQEGETVALLVSDRHDNIGMDQVAHAIGEAGGATVLLDAGDDTSTGSPWEAFSLDSLDATFEDYEYRYAITGNHDHGEFVGEYLRELGFERFDGEIAEGPDGIRFLGADDPRSSGLGSWRDETGLSFDEHAERVADQACEYDEEGERVSTLLVHDANTGKYALERGCVDLVVGGHLHEQLGPTAVVGQNGEVGYTYTTGTTGGAAYAIAIGSKIRRNAMVTLITYRDGRPVGIQPVTIRTVGDFRVGEYVELELAAPADTPAELEVGEPAAEAPAEPELEPLTDPSPATTSGPSENTSP